MTRVIELLCMDKVGVPSSSFMMPFPERLELPPCKLAFMALDKVKVRTSSPSPIASSITATSTVMLVWPAAKVRMLLTVV